MKSEPCITRLHFALFLGIWWHADFVIFALFSGVYLNLLNYWKVKSCFHV